MKTKALTMLCAGILAIFAISFVLAASTAFTVSPSSVTLTDSDASEDFTLTLTNSSELLDVTVTTPTINGVNFNVAGTTTGINTSSVLTVTPTAAIDWSNFNFLEVYSGNIQITDSTGSENVNLRLQNTQFCEVSNPGELDIKVDDVSNEGIGEDDKWYPFDIIEVDLEIENKGDEDVDNIVVEWGLYSESGDEWAIELIDEDDFDLKDGKDKIMKITIDLDKDLDVDLDELEDGDYTLYVRATGEVDDGSDTPTCVSDTEATEVVIEDDYVILDDIRLTGDQTCGGSLQLTADIWNIGSEDQDEVYVRIYNSELGINEFAQAGDIDAFEDKELNFEFSVPEDADEKTYIIKLDVYDDDDDIYENSEDEKSSYGEAVVVADCVKALEATVQASLEEGGQAGDEMKIKATVKNTADESGVFTVSVADYNSWSELVEVTPSSVTLGAGESKDVIITLDVDKDAEGTNSFNVMLTSDEGISLTQPIAANVESAGFSLKSVFGDNAYLWGIALANLVLIVIIIVIAVKVARR